MVVLNQEWMWGGGGPGSSHSRAWRECLRTELGTDTVPSRAACRETLLLLAPGRPDLALLGGLPGWPAAAWGCPVPSASSWLSQPRPSLASVVAALGLTQSHR